MRASTAPSYPARLPRPRRSPPCSGILRAGSEGGDDVWSLMAHQVDGASLQGLEVALEHWLAAEALRAGEHSHGAVAPLALGEVEGAVGQAQHLFEGEALGIDHRPGIGGPAHRAGEGDLLALDH